ncbi:MAG: hypothetical protein Q4D96_01465 [Propionibacteriaceae bacterium]|nr:hypothetical protein [Propionibacteriaceae bacterium]
MATELVLLSDVPVTLEAQRRALLRTQGEGQILEFRSGEISTLIGAGDKHLLTVHAPKVIRVADEAIPALLSPPRSFGLWTEMTVPFGAFEAGRVLADAIAAEVRGQIEERV